ncbi:F0F1 ATP synthase subunit delta [Paenibacillus sp. sptzw28]|uniref:F0F1 ATP synthase subunit delta n=1 Tax=Paenibacillus sp. sptzw28 TaxID=715179 RepID=UPI001C6F1808|nr:F0F1 ATP synthase subunit delta [Paenibacillus sp. sptzw28]QYR22055.1 F0F1 ATP synthase subunit delta [Paenibacillus sp. sptzw28]
MSRGSVVAKRYAKALFEIAKQNNAISDVEQELRIVVEALTKDAGIIKFLSFPNIETSQKVALIKGALSDKVSVMVLGTLELLISRGRHGVIGDVYEAYTKVAGEALGQARATVYTAKLLTAEELTKVEAQFGAIAGKKIVAEQIVEPALLGGVQVRIGDRLYDGSLQGKLSRLEKSLKTQAF